MFKKLQKPHPCIAALLLLPIALIAIGCDQVTDRLSSEMIVTNKYIGAGIRQDDDGFAYANFENTEATDGRLIKLQEVAELKEIRLVGTDVSDMGLGYLRNHELMERIHIENNGGISNAGLSNLPFKSPLKELTIFGTQVTNEGMASVAKFEGLKRLAVEGITDEGFGQLRNLDALEELDLLRCKITDRGIPHFAALSNLKQLQLTHCEITIPVERRLRQALPNTKVTTR